jgi:hypothetical protein
MQPISRPYLISLLEKGEVHFDLVGRDRRVKAEELFAYKRARDDRRRKALAELAAMDADTFKALFTFANRYTAFVDAWSAQRMRSSPTPWRLTKGSPSPSLGECARIVGARRSQPTNSFEPWKREDCSTPPTR